MKTILSLRIQRIVSYAAIFMIMLPPALNSQITLFGVASNPADNGSVVTNTVTITPPASMAAGDLVIIYAHLGATGASLTVSAGQPWTSETANSGSTQTARIFWCRFNGTWGASPVISGGNGTNPLSAVMYVYRPTSASNLWGVHDPLSSGGTTNTTVNITGLTTTVPNTVTMAFWSSPTANTWTSLTGTGWSKTGFSAQYRNTGGADQSNTAAYYILSSAGTVPNVSQTQSSSQSTRTGIICWYEYPPAPGNDLCGSPVTLTSGTSCSNTAGTIGGATLTAPTITAPNCASGAVRDVWYRFTAQTPNPTITISNLASEFTNPGIQLLSNSCSATFTNYYCGTTSINANSLVPGTTYFVRVYSTSSTGPTSSTAGAFDICVQDPVATAPFNDECVNAIVLPVGTSCSNIPGRVNGSTLSTPTITGSCSGTVAYDVWYKFTAVSSSTTLTISSAGSNFVSPRIQLLSDNCGGTFTSLVCGASPVAYATTAGTTYYVRVYSGTGPAPNGNANFNICATSSSAPVRFGNSYVNITRKTTGGVVQTGDILEIRMTINHTSGTMSRLRFVDNVPTKTTIATGVADNKITVITNEGLMYKSYTQAGGDDAATYSASPGAGEYNIRMNLGFGATSPGIPTNNTATEFASATGSMLASSDRPRGGGGMLFAIAYRVQVTGITGDTINLNPAQFIYYNGTSDITLTATPFKIIVSDPLTLCENSIGVNIAGENGGTFGSGTSLNRGNDLNTPIGGYSFISEMSYNFANTGNTVGDGRYAVVKNISPTSNPFRDARRIPNCGTGLLLSDPYACENRMYRHWYIDGDHTGTSNSTGNNPPSSSTNSGYMLLVNADYVASEIYRQTINNLCPNTYYEFSAWVRNICATCGADSTGAQFTGTPTAPAAGYPGVYPNLSFLLNDIDYYSTGEVDTLGWLKKGFVFMTGPAQTSATFSIRNNSQGGGGNDWVLDDIGIRTCAPDVVVTPGPNPFVCDSNTVNLGATIASYFNNYVYYLWEKSIDNGATWTSTGEDGGPMTPIWNGSAWSYDVVYPEFVAYGVDSGSQYRVIVASSASNISDPNCSFSANATITLTVDPCGALLDIDIISFKGKNINNYSVLSWTVTKEQEPVKYEIQKSKDGRQFVTIGEIEGFKNPSFEQNNYSFNDPEPLDNTISWYRVKATTTQNNKHVYTKVIQLIGKQDGLQIESLVNPFSSKVKFDLISGDEGIVQVQILDQYQHVVKTVSHTLVKGRNNVTVTNTENLPAGFYILRVVSGNNVINRKIIKN